MKKAMTLTMLLTLLLMSGCGDDGPIPPEFPKGPYLGDGWYVYNEENSLLPWWTVTAIAIDSHGRKWIGTEGKGLATFAHPDSAWTLYPQLGFVNTIYVDPNDVVWVGTERAGLWKFADSTWTWIGDLLDGTVYAITTDLTGNLWVGTKNAGLMKFDGQSWANYNTRNSGISADWVFSLAVDHDNVLWIGTAWTDDERYPLGGVTRYDGQTWQVFNDQNSLLPKYQTVYSLAVDAENRKWIGTGKGLTLHENAKWILYTRDDFGLPDDSMTAISINISDHEDVWIGVYAGGFAKFDGDVWTAYKPAEHGIRSSLVNAVVYENRTHKVWVGLSGGGLVCYEDQ